jgi:hypothetical protein
MTEEQLIATYKWAVVRLATVQFDRRQKGVLLFASVMLLTPDRPEPLHPKSSEIKEQTAEWFGRYPCNGKGTTVYFRKTVLSAEDAMGWYRNLNPQDAKLPIPSVPTDKCAKIDGVDIACSGFVDDPIWPNLGLPVGTEILGATLNNTAPTLFTGQPGCRIHRRFGANKGVETVTENDEMIKFLAKRLHINLREYPEYLGSVTLVAPDPIVASIDCQMIKKNNGEEAVFYRIVPRSGQFLSDLTLTTLDYQTGLLTGIESQPIPSDGVVVLPKGKCDGEYGYAIKHNEQGVLRYFSPKSFIRSIQVNMGIIAKTLNVSVPWGESPEAPLTKYSVRRTEPADTITSGETSYAENPSSRVWIVSHNRQIAAMAENLDQRWFPTGTREQAMNFIRQRIGQARERILIADPYFGVLQIPQYLLAVTSDTVRIEILTSSLAFQNKNSPEAIRYRVETHKGQKNIMLGKGLSGFESALQVLKDAGQNEVFVKVLSGSPKLHDRFLVVDNMVWFIGGSLNNLGVRASMIIKLPNPNPVLVELDKMCDEAEDWEAFSQTHIKGQGEDGIYTS